jgi:hypothetical protein
LQSDFLECPFFLGFQPSIVSILTEHCPYCRGQLNSLSELFLEKLEFAQEQRKAAGAWGLKR